MCVCVTIPESEGKPIVSKSYHVTVFKHRDITPYGEGKAEVCILSRDTFASLFTILGTACV